MICSLYRKDETHEPEVYVAAVAAVLAGYPKYIIEYVCDPRTGITGTSKWLPSVAEIRTACEQEISKIRREEERERRVEDQIYDRITDEKVRKEGRNLSYDELKEKYGDGKGGWLGEGGKIRTYTEEERAAFLRDAQKTGKEIQGMKLSFRA